MKAFVAVIAGLVAAASGARFPRDYQSQQQGSASTRSSVSVAAEPIAIVRSVYNAPGTEGFEDTFNYSFEAENGIQQEASGELRTVADEDGNDSDVMVMKGSYSFIGEDGEEYVVDWYADETGFHPSAAHLPQSVEPDHPEVQEAVAAQLRFAEEERAAEERAAASSVSNRYAQPAQPARAAAPSNSYAQPAQSTSRAHAAPAAPVRSAAPVRAAAPSNSYSQPAQAAAPTRAAAPSNSYSQPAPAAAPARAAAPSNSYSQPARAAGPAPAAAAALYTAAEDQLPQYYYVAAAAPAPASQPTVVAARANSAYSRFNRFY